MTALSAGIALWVNDRPENPSLVRSSLSRAQLRKVEPLGGQRGFLGWCSRIGEQEVGMKRTVEGDRGCALPAFLLSCLPSKLARISPAP